MEGPDWMNTGNCPTEYRGMETNYTGCLLMLLFFAEEIKGIKAISFYPLNLKKTKEYRGRWREVLLQYLGLLKAVWEKRRAKDVLQTLKNGTLVLFVRGRDWKSHWHRDLKWGKWLKITENSEKFRSYSVEIKDKTNVTDSYKVRGGWAVAKFDIS